MKRINIHSFRFFLSASFITQALLVFALVLITILTLSGVLSQGVHIMQSVQPTQMWTEKLRANLLSASGHLDHHLVAGDTNALAVSQKVWEKDVQEALDKIETFRPNWNYAEYRITWTEIKFEVDKLKRSHQEIYAEEDPLAQRALFDQEALPIMNELDRQLAFFFETVRVDAVTEGDRLISKIYGFFYTEAITYLILVVILILIYRILNGKIRKMIKRIKTPIAVLSEGNLPQKVGGSKDELSNVLEEIHTLGNNLKNVKDFALQVGKGNFDNTLAVFEGHGEIGSSLAEMRNSLAKVDEQDKQRDWINSGFNRYGELIRKHGDNLQELTEELIKSLVKFLDANQGGFFVVEENEEEETKEMVLRATYAYDRQKYEERRIKHGEGILGQAWQEKDVVEMNKLPDDYLYITSGLGYSTANYLVLVPLITNEEVYGMFEIGSFSPLHQYQVDFLKGLAETVAAAINTVKVNDNTRRLLNESQELTEQMRAQEEEMRQNMEELQATQEEMKRGADDAEAKVHRLNTILNSTSDPLITVTSNGIIDAFNYAAESLFGYNASEVVDHNIGVILPEEKVVRRELVETSNNPIERARVITRRRMEGIRKGGKRFLAEVAIKDTFYDGQKYFTVQVRDISAEEERVSSLEQSNRKLKLELEAANSESNRADRSEREMRLRHLALDRSTLLMDLSADGKITHVNELAEKALELASEELEGKSFKEVLAALNDSEAFSYFWKQVLESQVILKQDLQLVGAANKTVWTHSAFAKVLDEKGELVKVLVIAQDISTQMFQLSETKAQIAELQNAQPEGAGEAVSEEMQQRLNELRELQTKIGDDLSQVMQANEERLREAIDLKERSFRK